MFVADLRMMQDPVKDATRMLEVWSVKTVQGSAQALLESIKAEAAAANVDMLVLKADRIFGADHLKSALYHAKKAIDEKRNASDSLAMETLLYASGERQLSTAIKKMSIDHNTTEVVIAKLTDGEFRPRTSWSTLPATPDVVDREALVSFGVSNDEMATLNPGKVTDLVLEKVASVDILKK